MFYFSAIVVGFPVCCHFATKTQGNLFIPLGWKSDSVSNSMTCTITAIARTTPSLFFASAEDYFLRWFFIGSACCTSAGLDKAGQMAWKADFINGQRPCAAVDITTQGKQTNRYNQTHVFCWLGPHWNPRQLEESQRARFCLWFELCDKVCVPTSTSRIIA